MHYYLKEAKSHSTIEQLDEISSGKISIKLFEFDRRFEVYGEDYVFYDYKEPLNIPETLENAFDLIIADPPFLSSECHIKTGMTIRKLGREDYKLIICTGKYN